MAATTSAPTGQRFRAGRRFHYSNVGYAALGRLLEVHHGKGWFEVVHGELLEPLGMLRTTTRPTGSAAHGLAVHPFADVLLPEPEHDAGAMAPAGQLWTTVQDLARWAAFLGGNTHELLSAATLSEMLEPHHVVDEPGRPWEAAQRAGLAAVERERHPVRRSRRLDAGLPRWPAGALSSGKRHHGIRARDGNRRRSGRWRRHAHEHDGEQRPQEPRDRPARHARELEPASVQPWSASGDASLLELVGTWHWGPAVEVATLVGEHLVIGEPGAGRGSRFRRIGVDIWEGLDGYHTGEPLRVVRGHDGSVSHLDLASFRFTRTPYDPEADVPGGVDETGWA